MEWYGQAGTPSVAIEKIRRKFRAVQLDLQADERADTRQDQKRPLLIPVRLGLLDKAGQEMPLCLDGENPTDAPMQRTINLSESSETVEFIGIENDPVVSALRDFSAPVTLSAPLRDSDRAFLFAHDKDPFNRWEAGQQYAIDYLLASIAALQKEKPKPASAEFVSPWAVCCAIRRWTRRSRRSAMLLPSEEYLGNQMTKVDVAAIHQARENLRQEIAANCGTIC